VSALRLVRLFSVLVWVLGRGLGSEASFVGPEYGLKGLNVVWNFEGARDIMAGRCISLGSGIRLRPH
jgi:hypothetical protein